MVASLSATATEWSVEDSLKIVAQRVGYDFNHLLTIIKTSPLLRNRYEWALAKDYTFLASCPEELLDVVFSLDLVINYRGWTIGIDVTLDELYVPRKLGRLRAMAHEHSLIEIDISVVWLIHKGTDLSDKGVRARLSQAIAAKREGVGPICLK